MPEEPCLPTAECVPGESQAMSMMPADDVGSSFSDEEWQVALEEAFAAEMNPADRDAFLQATASGVTSSVAPVLVSAAAATRHVLTPAPGPAAPPSAKGSSAQDTALGATSHAWAPIPVSSAGATGSAHAPAPLPALMKPPPIKRSSALAAAAVGELERKTMAEVVDQLLAEDQALEELAAQAKEAHQIRAERAKQAVLEEAQRIQDAMHHQAALTAEAARKATCEKAEKEIADKLAAEAQQIRVERAKQAAVEEAQRIQDAMNHQAALLILEAARKAQCEEAEKEMAAKLAAEAQQIQAERAKAEEAQRIKDAMNRQAALIAEAARKAQCEEAEKEMAAKLAAEAQAKAEEAQQIKDTMNHQAALIAEASMKAQWHPRRWQPRNLKRPPGREAGGCKSWPGRLIVRRQKRKQR